MGYGMTWCAKKGDRAWGRPHACTPSSWSQAEYGIRQWEHRGISKAVFEEVKVYLCLEMQEDFQSALPSLSCALEDAVPYARNSAFSQLSLVDTSELCF